MGPRDGADLCTMVLQGVHRLGCTAALILMTIARTLAIEHASETGVSARAGCWGGSLPGEEIVPDSSRPVRSA